MEPSELNLTQSFTADSVGMNASRMAPRKLDVSLLPLPTPKPQTSTKYKPVLDINDHSVQLSPSYQSELQHKLMVDHSFTNTQRDEESKIRYELERSKAQLIEQYQVNEAKLTTELNDCKAYYEQKLLEREAFWTEQGNEKHLHIIKLESKVNDIVEMSRKRIADKEKVNVEQLEQQEIEWRHRIEEVEHRHQEILNSMHSKHVLEKKSRDLAEKARIEAKEDQIRAKYEQKMKKYETQIQEVMRNYRDKELIIHGSLDEARKEIVLMRAAATAKEDTLREELAVKDRLILTLKAELHKIDEITKIADSWRSAANDLARMVVQACVSVQDLPPVPLAPQEKENMPNLFPGYGKPEEISKEKAMYMMEVKAINRLRKDHVLIQKELIGRSLRNSKVNAHLSVHLHIVSTLLTTCVIVHCTSAESSGASEGRGRPSVRLQDRGGRVALPCCFAHAGISNQRIRKTKSFSTGFVSSLRTCGDKTSPKATRPNRTYSPLSNHIILRAVPDGDVFVHASRQQHGVGGAQRETGDEVRVCVHDRAHAAPFLQKHRCIERTTFL